MDEHNRGYESSSMSKYRGYQAPSPKQNIEDAYSVGQQNRMQQPLLVGQYRTAEQPPHEHKTGQESFPSRQSGRNQPPRRGDKPLALFNKERRYYSSQFRQSETNHRVPQSNSADFSKEQEQQHWKRREYEKGTSYDGSVHVQTEQQVNRNDRQSIQTQDMLRKHQSSITSSHTENNKGKSRNSEEDNASYPADDNKEQVVVGRERNTTTPELKGDKENSGVTKLDWK